MIIDPKASESGNPFRDGLNAEASLNSDHVHNPGALPSPQISSPESNTELSGPSYPPPDHPPPGYTHGEIQQYMTTPSSVSEKGGLSAGQPLSTQPQSPSSSTYSSPMLSSTYANSNYPTFSSHSYATYANSTEPSSRQAPQQEYPSFEPTFIIASGQFLTRGFPDMPPPSKITPHPFASHDVTESDWIKFLSEVKQAGRLTERQENWARLPIVSIVPIVGEVSTHVIRQQMKKGKAKDVMVVINHWNHHFFNPRHIEVVLMRGVTRFGGSGAKGSNGSTPGWSGTSLIQQTVASGSVGKKGKAKEEEDTTYRLFIMPFEFYTHTQ